MTKHTYDVTTKTRKQMCSKTAKQFNNWVDNDFGPCVKNGCPAEHYKSIGAGMYIVRRDTQRDDSYVLTF